MLNAGNSSETLALDEVVSLVLMKDLILTVYGSVTGRKYVWHGSGSIVEDVDVKDAEVMMQMPLPPSCCGSYPTPYFQIVGR